MKTNRSLALFLSLSMGLSLTACGGAKQAEETKATEKEQLAGDLNNDGQIEMGQDGVEVEVNVSDVHMNAADAFAAGKWEALFTPVDMEGRAIDMADFDLTPTEEEKKPWRANRHMVSRSCITCLTDVPPARPWQMTLVTMQRQD